MVSITEEILSIQKHYGCQVIVNGLASTLKYYLRLLADTDKFIDEHVKLLEEDEELSFDLKRQWNISVVGDTS